MSNVLNESAENYLETILILSQKLPVVRSVDIANELGFKKSSVSVAMKNLRENPPKELAGKKVLAVRDYLADTRTDCEGHVTPAGLPKSDVLYFELVDDAWVCIRPSGTEPKIKLYVNTNAKHPEDSAKENAELVEACKALMA